MMGPYTNYIHVETGKGETPKKFVHIENLDLGPVSKERSGNFTH